MTWRAGTPQHVLGDSTPFPRGGQKRGLLTPLGWRRGLGSPGLGRDGGLCFCGVAGGSWGVGAGVAAGARAGELTTLGRNSCSYSPRDQAQSRPRTPLTPAAPSQPTMGKFTGLGTHTPKRNSVGHTGHRALGVQQTSLCFGAEFRGGQDCHGMGMEPQGCAAGTRFTGVSEEARATVRGG